MFLCSLWSNPVEKTATVSNMCPQSCAHLETTISLQLCYQGPSIWLPEGVLSPESPRGCPGRFQGFHSPLLGSNTEDTASPQAVS